MLMINLDTKTICLNVRAHLTTEIRKQGSFTELCLSEAHH
jgi:hypothetical protein